MFCEKRGRAATNVFGVLKTLAVIAAVMIALLLTGCGNESNSSKSGRDKEDEEETLRFKTPEEQYRYVEGAVFEKAGASLAGAFDNALESASLTGRKVGAEVTLELFEPAEQMLETYTGMDFSWLKTLGVSAGANLAEDGAAIEASVSLNKRELIGMEMLADLTRGTLYGRVPLLSEEYFQIDQSGYNSALFYYHSLLSAMEQTDELSAMLPDGKTVSKLLSRCAEAALEQIEDVDEGSETLTAGDVSAKYTTLTLTLTEDLLQDMAEAVCDVLTESKDVEEIIENLEEAYGVSFYDELLEELERLPDRIRMDDEIEITLYVDGSNEIRGRVIEFDDYILRCVMPEDKGDFGFELSVENTRYEELLFRLSGEGQQGKGTLDGTFTFEMDDTEWFTLSVEDLDTESLEDGELIGKLTFRPTYDFYTNIGVYSLTARTLEEFSYVLELGRNDAAFEVYMDDEPFLALTEHVENGRAERLPTVSGAKDISSWSRSLLTGGGLEDYLDYLKGSDIPTELLQQLLGVAF